MRHMTLRPLSALKFSALRRFDVASGPGAIVAVFFASDLDKHQPAADADQQGLGQEPRQAEPATEHSNVVSIRRGLSEGTTHG